MIKISEKSVKSELYLAPGDVPHEAGEGQAVQFWIFSPLLAEVITG